VSGGRREVWTADRLALDEEELEIRRPRPADRRCRRRRMDDDGGTVAGRRVDERRHRDVTSAADLRRPIGRQIEDGSKKVKAATE